MERRRIHALVLLAVTALVGALLFQPAEAGSDTATALLVLALVAFGAFLALEARHRLVSRRAVLACCGVLLALAAVVPLQRSRDVWSYAVLGRMVSVHGGNPYVDEPADFPNDPYLAEVAPGWRHGVTVYGPAFVAIAAGVTEVTGTSKLATRIAFQSVAAVAMLAALLLIDRATRDPLAVALVGLNPVIVVYTVAGGHNDALIGAGLLAGVLAATRRPALAGLVLALAALVKIVAVLALPVLAAWLLWQHRYRAAAWLTATAVGVLAAGYGLIGRGQALDALRAARDQVSWSSIWRPIQERLVDEGQRAADTHLGRPASLLVLAVAGLLAASHLADRDGPDRAVASALVVYVLGAAYTLVWYLAWVLPLLALRPRSLLARVTLAYAAVLLVAAEHSQGESRDRLDRLLDHAVDLLHVVAVAALVVLCAAAVWRLARRPRAAYR